MASLKELVKTSTGRNYVALELVKACHNAEQISKSPAPPPTEVWQHAPLVIKVEKSRYTDQGWLTFHETPSSFDETLGVVEVTEACMQEHLSRKGYLERQLKVADSRIAELMEETKRLQRNSDQNFDACTSQTKGRHAAERELYELRPHAHRLEEKVKELEDALFRMKAARNELEVQKRKLETHITSLETGEHIRNRCHNCGWHNPGDMICPKCFESSKKLIEDLRAQIRNVDELRMEHNKEADARVSLANKACDELRAKLAQSQQALHDARVSQEKAESTTKTIGEQYRELQSGFKDAEWDRLRREEKIAELIKERDQARKVATARAADIRHLTSERDRYRDALEKKDVEIQNHKKGFNSLYDERNKERESYARMVKALEHTGGRLLNFENEIADLKVENEKLKKRVEDEEKAEEKMTQLHDKVMDELINILVPDFYNPTTAVASSGCAYEQVIQGVMRMRKLLGNTPEEPRGKLEQMFRDGLSDQEIAKKSKLTKAEFVRMLRNAINQNVFKE